MRAHPRRDTDKGWSASGGGLAPIGRNIPGQIAKRGAAMWCDRLTDGGVQDKGVGDAPVCEFISYAPAQRKALANIGPDVQLWLGCENLIALNG